MNKQPYLQALGIDVWKQRQTPMPHTQAEIPQTTQVEATATTTLDWQRLRDTVANCTLCPLHKGRTQTVFGVGNPQADLLIVGEAPGFYEDKQGEPFVGQAGKLLDKMLAAINLSRDTIYIANVLKCRPPQNRDPKPEEIKRCTQYLEQQIALIQPKLMVALGRIAAHYLLNTNTPLSRLRGHLHPFGERKTPLIVTYHPAYLLRNPADKRKSWEDLQWIRDELKTLGSE